MGKKLVGNGIFESSRMILPEHIKAIVRHKEMFKKDRPTERPTIDE